MRKLLLSTLLYAFVVQVNAQQNKTTVYQCCSLDEHNAAVYQCCSPDKHLTKANSNFAAPFFAPWPEFPGGIGDFYTYLSNHLQYPPNALHSNIQGRVIVSLIIEADGSISHAKVIRGVAGDLDNEALRLVNNSPKWKPGMVNGEPVRVKRTLPVNFILASNTITY